MRRFARLTAALSKKLRKPHPYGRALLCVWYEFRADRIRPMKVAPAMASWAVKDPLGNGRYGPSVVEAYENSAKVKL